MEEGVKKCKRCDISKEKSLFFSDERYRDGMAPWCKECRKLYQRERMRANPERHRRDIASWRMAHRDRYLEIHRESARRYRGNPVNRVKELARGALNYAISRGYVVKGKCADCGSAERVQGHHHDYTKPIDVTWLCPKCHARRRHATA